MIVVERASEEDLPDIFEIDQLTMGDDSRRDYLIKSVIDRHMLVARRGFQRLGFAVVNRAFFEQVFIALLVVHPDHRRQGIGSALMTYAEKTCPEPKLFTSTNASNSIMQALLTVRGYRRSGSVENLDPGDPELIYVRFLGDSSPT